MTATVPPDVQEGRRLLARGKKTLAEYAAHDALDPLRQLLFETTERTAAKLAAMEEYYAALTALKKSALKKTKPKRGP